MGFKQRWAAQEIRRIAIDIRLASIHQLFRKLMASGSEVKSLNELYTEKTLERLMFDIMRRGGVSPNTPIWEVLKQMDFTKIFIRPLQRLEKNVDTQFDVLHDVFAKMNARPKQFVDLLTEFITDHGPAEAKGRFGGYLTSMVTNTLKQTGRDKQQQKALGITTNEDDYTPGTIQERNLGYREEDEVQVIDTLDDLLAILKKHVTTFSYGFIQFVMESAKRGWDIGNPDILMLFYMARLKKLPSEFKEKKDELEAAASNVDKFLDLLEFYNKNSDKHEHSTEGKDFNQVKAFGKNIWLRKVKPDIQKAIKKLQDDDTIDFDPDLLVNLILE